MRKVCAVHLLVDASNPSTRQLTCLAFLQQHPVTKTILEYLANQNRPFSGLEIQTNLKLGKTIVNKLLTQLQEKGAIHAKLYSKSWIYMAKQDEVPSVSSDELEQMDAKIESMKESNAELKAIIKQSEATIHLYEKQLTDDQLRKAISELEKKNTDYEARLNGLQNGAVQMTQEEKKEINTKYEIAKKAWNQRKKMFKDIWSSYTENLPINPKEHMEELGIETDEMVGVNEVEFHSKFAS